MVQWKRFLLVSLIVTVLLIMSACGTDNTTGTSPTAQPTTPPTPTTAPATPTTAPSAATIKTASVNVAGKSMTVLVDARGYTLYYFTKDTAQKTACTGACAQNWPPVLFTGSGTVTADPSLPGELKAVQDDLGNHVQYNGHFLYTFAADTAAGQATGEGKASNTWHVATPDLAKM